MPKKKIEKAVVPSIKKADSKPKSKHPQLLRGMKDILPDAQEYWDFIRREADRAARDYGYGKIDTSILEETSLFTRAVGENTDIVEKEMFSFIDKGGDNVSLRPENTAGIARAYTEHGMINQPQPVRLYYWGPFFRYDRPQAGRYRQFHQFGFESLGDIDPIIDAQMIVMAWGFFKTIGLPVTIQINSVGCKKCRKEYGQLLVDYFNPRKKFLCDDCKRRLSKNSLRVLDCKNEECRKLIEDAPQIVDHLDEECKEHFMKVLEYLDGAEITYSLNPYLVRGLDYYTKTTFEIYPEAKEEAQSALAGGGRYDGLIELLGGRPTPAIGFAAGIERIVISMKEKEVILPVVLKPEIFVAQLGVSAKKKALNLLEELRQKGIRVSSNFSSDGLKNQLALASKLGVKFCLILGQKEILDRTILIRDMEGGSQEVVDFNKTAEELKRKLDKAKTLIPNDRYRAQEIRNIE